VQGDAESFVRGAIEEGHPDARVKFFASSEDAAGFVCDLLQSGDLLLVKGSRGVKMERIVEALDKRYGRIKPESTAVRGQMKERG
jgi:UDP-N-acetylmuramoyl-tripeptide--D-alanyl-D-alanine ligase